MTDERNFTEELALANEALEFTLKRFDQLLTDVSKHLADSKDPLSASKRAARSELDDLAETDTELMKLELLLKAPRSDANSIREKILARMNHLCIPGERQRVSIDGFTLSPIQHSRSVKPIEGLEWTSPEIHQTLIAYGFDSIVKETVAWQSAMAARNELKAKYGENEPIPTKFVPQLDADGDPVIDTETGEALGTTYDFEKLIVPNTIDSMRREKAKK